MPNKKLANAVGIIVVHDKKILLLHRDNRPDISNPNKWCLIGGMVESGENKKETALREAKEEIGIDLPEIKYVETQKLASGRERAVFLTTLTSEEVGRLKLGDEGQEIKFFSFDELENLPMSGTIKKYFDDNRQNELKEIMMTVENLG